MACTYEDDGDSIKWGELSKRLGQLLDVTGNLSQQEKNQLINNLVYLAKRDENDGECIVACTADNVCVVRATHSDDSIRGYKMMVLIDDYVLVEGVVMDTREEAMTGLRDTTEIRRELNEPFDNDEE